MFRHPLLTLRRPFDPSTGSGTASSGSGSGCWSIVRKKVNSSGAKWKYDAYADVSFPSAPRTRVLATDDAFCVRDRLLAIFRDCDTATTGRLPRVPISDMIWPEVTHQITYVIRFRYLIITSKCSGTSSFSRWPSRTKTQRVVLFLSCPPRTVFQVVRSLSTEFLIHLLIFRILSAIVIPQTSVAEPYVPNPYVTAAIIFTVRFESVSVTGQPSSVLVIK